jgi:hypothetical protein
MRSLLATILALCLLPLSVEAKRKPVRKGKSRAVITRAVLLPAERAMLLRSFTSEQVSQELAHRLLSLYSLKELQAEAARRGLR